MNWNLFLIFVAVGAIAELMTMKYPTPGERIATIFQLFVGGFIAAAVIPPIANTAVLTGLFIATCGRVVGSLLSPRIDAIRVYLDEKKENAKTTYTKRP